MTKSIPGISKYMTTVPHTINADNTIAEAKKIMRDHEIRHLPVMNLGKVVGIITDRDITFIQAFKGVDSNVEKVDQAMTIEPYTVKIDTALDEVCQVMAENKYGSVLVEDNHKLVGIFTWVDALRATHELLITRLK
ncbi:MAG: CBS domain-containing protein [Bacteriovorax sp.]|jgi:acetoin utilization protein AcuB|nr:CBS domain-containing protein [Bacteriovorax sp.]